MLNATDPLTQADLLADILKNTKSINASLVVADESGVRWPPGGAAAPVMKKLQETEHSQGNFKVAAIPLVPPLTPFYPRSYHTPLRPHLALAPESANTAVSALHR